MSMIDCKINITKKPDPKGDRIVLTFECVSFSNPLCQTLMLSPLSGKFLPYAKW